MLTLSKKETCREKVSTCSTFRIICLQAESLSEPPSFTSVLCRWCGIFPHCSSAPTGTPSPILFQVGCDFRQEMKQMTSSWDTFGNSCFAYFQPCSLFGSSRKHILISAKSILIFTSASPTWRLVTTSHLQESENKHSSLCFSSSACSVITIATLTLPGPPEDLGVESFLCYPPGQGLGGFHSHIPVLRGYMSCFRTLAFFLKTTYYKSTLLTQIQDFQKWKRWVFPSTTLSN